jgi:hypothetical protein
LSLPDRNKLIRSWSGITTANKGNTDAIEDETAFKATVLVSTLAVAGVGLNLTAANHCIITDLAFTTGEHIQGFGRIHRTGQLRDTKLWGLWMSDNGPEARFKMRQDSRKNIQDSAWSVTALQQAEDKRRQDREEARLLEQEEALYTV